MSQHRLERDLEVAAQREVTRIALAGVDGFALAGSGAIREHGMIDRPTEDVDLFTNRLDVAAFGTAVDQVISDLQASGYQVDQTRRSAQFARLHVTTSDGLQLDVDLGVDWRQDLPVTLDVGPVLSLADAVGNKVSALYSRGEARDYLDMDAIRASGRFSDEQLVTAAGERDAGFEVGMFAQQLDAVARLQVAQVARYGYSADQLDAIKTRFTQWAEQLRNPPTSETPERAVAAKLQETTERMKGHKLLPTTPPSSEHSTPERRPTQQSGPDRGVER